MPVAFQVEGSISTNPASLHAPSSVPGVAKGVSITPSSVTPDGGKNPSFRIYEADAVTGEMLDYVQYRLDLGGQGEGNRKERKRENRVCRACNGKRAPRSRRALRLGLVNNLNKSAHAFFYEAHRATVEYGMQSIAPSEYLKLVKRMEVRCAARCRALLRYYRTCTAHLLTTSPPSPTLTRATRSLKSGSSTTTAATTTAVRVGFVGVPSLMQSSVSFITTPEPLCPPTPYRAAACSLFAGPEKVDDLRLAQRLDRRARRLPLQRQRALLHEL